ncbi:MAG: biosynthesis choline kinase, partial [Oscillospiraceae bacterium]|nr:biosynthesis choline kinase [Oscillospiraceae bacterium]
MEKNLKILEVINEQKNLTQREIAQISLISLGTVNTTLKRLGQDEYISVVKSDKKICYEITDKGSQYLEDEINKQKKLRLPLNKNDSKPIKTAVILAAGQAKEFDIPVGLLNVGDEKLIDRTLDVLSAHGISEIYMVIGFKGEMYEQHLSSRNVTFIYNKQYQSTGTMYSLSLAKETIKDDFLLIESDLLFEENAIKSLLQSSKKDCLLLASPRSSGDEAFVELDENGDIYRISKDIHQLNQINGEVIGISKISQELFRKMTESFSKNNNKKIYYEYVIENIGRIYKINSLLVDDLAWGEIDNKAQYDNILSSKYPRIKRKEQELKINTIKQDLLEILQINEDDIKSIDSAGGMTNNNYKAKINDQDYILRIPGKGTEDMISRKNEYFNSKIGSLLGINVNCVYFNEQTGIKLTEYIKNAETLTPSTAKLENNMKLTTEILRKLHTSGMELNNEFDVFKEIASYEDIISKNEIKNFDDYET